MPRVLTAYVSDFQRDRVHRSDFYRGESRIYSAEFRAVIPEAQSIAYVEWRCDRPDVTIMSDATCDSHSSAVALVAGSPGLGTMKAQAVLTDGSVVNQMFVVGVNPSPWYTGESGVVTQGATYLRADNSGLLQIFGDAPSGTVGQNYSYTYTAAGGSGDYVFTIASGSIPPGLLLSTNGVLSGIPTVQGNFSWTVKVQDSSFATRTKPDSASIAAKATYQDYIVSQGPDLYYPMSDTDSVCRELIQNLNGSYTGLTITRQRPSLMPNGQGFAAQFVAMTDYVSIPINSVLSNYNKPLTIEWWGNFAANPENGSGVSIIQSANDNDRTIYAALRYDRQAEAGSLGASSNNLVTGNGGPLIAATSQYFAIVFGLTDTRIYRNGTLYYTQPAPINAISASATAYRLMGPYISTQPSIPTRTLQNLAVYTRALTASDVMAHYTAGST